MLSITVYINKYTYKEFTLKNISEILHRLKNNKSQIEIK